MSYNLIILFATPVFILLIFTEFIYGLIKQKNNYRLNDTFMSINLGILSRIPEILNLGFATLIYDITANHFSLGIIWENNIYLWVIAFIFYDFLYYWLHRASHRINILWAAHSVHHHGEEFNLATALRQTSTGFLSKWIFFIPSFIVGFPAEVFFAVGALNLIYQFWVHTEHIGKLGFLEYILVTPSNHRIHHAINDEYIDANYGGVFIIWDRLFGSFVEENADKVIIYGTKSPLRSWNPFWANFQVYNHIYKSFFTANNLKEIFNFLFKPPEWSSNKLNQKNMIFTEKYETLISNDLKLTILVLFALTLSSSAILSIFIGQINQIELVICLTFIINSIYFISKISECKALQVKYEFIKLASFLLLFIFIFDKQHLVQLTMIIHAIISLIFIHFISHKSFRYLKDR